MTFTNDYDVILHTLEKEHKELQTKARKGDRESQCNLSWLMWRCKDKRYAPETEDEEWLAQLAEESFYPALYLYLKGNRYTNNITNEKKESLVAKYFDKVYENKEDIVFLKEGVINIANDFNLCGLYSDRAPKLIEMLEILAEYDNDCHWNGILATLYYDGRAQLGICPDAQKSKAYYTKALNSYECTDVWRRQYDFLDMPIEDNALC